MNPTTTNHQTEYELRIEGMHCASCAANVQRALASVAGVRQAEVNFATNHAKVEAVESVDAQALTLAVQRAGYKAEVLTQEEEADPAEAIEAERKRAEAENRAWRTQFIGSAIASLVLMLTASLHAFSWGHALIASAIQIWAGGRFYRGAWRGLAARSANMDTLIALGTTAAWGQGFWMMAKGEHAAHEFMTAPMLLAFVSLGKWLEGRGRIRAGQALGMLLELAPSKAHLVSANGEVAEIESLALKPGDRCRVWTGERIPADGRLGGAPAEIDEGMLTGESTPALKRPGDPLFGGTVNVGSALTLAVEKVGSATALRQIARRVEEAQNTRPKMQALADAVAAVFVPVVLALAAATLSLSLLFSLGAAESISRAVAVLIVACPCALGLATPLAVMAGVGVAARRGMIVRSAETLEISNSIKTIVFDKTGTLTVGAPEVTGLFPTPDHDETELLAAAGSLEAESPHPIAKAILSSARLKGIPSRPLGKIENVTGQGLRSRSPALALGSAEFLRSEKVEMSEFAPDVLNRQSRGETIIGVGVPNGPFVGAIALADRIKPGSAQAIEELRALGLRTVLISGDSEGATLAVAQLLKIDDHRARVAPSAKADAVKAMQKEGAKVAMVGDGINDAPALAQAELGIAMASGSDIAQQASGIVLLGGDPRQVASAIRLARAVRRKMIQNLAWAFVYNLALIPIAAFGLLQPIYASAAMAASSVSVVGNALLLYRWGRGR